MFFSLQQYQNQLFQQTEDVDGKTEIIIKVSSSYFMKSPLFFVVLHVKIQRCVVFFFLLLWKSCILWLAWSSGRDLSFL